MHLIRKTTTKTKQFPGAIRKVNAKNQITGEWTPLDYS